MSVLIGGVSELYQGDLDVGRIAVQRLGSEQLGPAVSVEDFHYGAVAVAQRLQDVCPDALVLVGAILRGRRPGAVVRARVDPLGFSGEELQSAVGDAVTGYVDIDLVLKVGAALDALPHRITTIEIEPERLDPSEHLSASAAAALERALELVRTEVRRAPSMIAADEVRAALAAGEFESCAAVDAMRELVDQLGKADVTGHWGQTFAARDRVKRAISEGRTGEGMTGLDWGLWWSLLEELDRVQAVEARAV